MTVKYKTVITKAGAEKLAAATVPNGKKVNFTAMALGDGGGTLPMPDASQTRLVNEVWRHALNKISQDNKKRNYVIAELLIPPETGGFWMREMGLYDDTGTLIAVGNMAESYKPLLDEGSGRAQTVRMVIMVSDIASVELSIDTSMVMATQEYVDEKLEEHEQSRRHPDATTKDKGFTQLSSSTDSTSETLAATPKAVKAAYDLAAGKYTAQDATTGQKGIVQLSSATDSTSEVLAATPKAVKAVNDKVNERVPLGRKINGRMLTEDIIITAQDIFDGQAVEIGNAADLNTYTMPGLYYQPSNVQALAGKNYPEFVAGSLEVYKHAGVTQIYRIYADSRSYIRTLYSSSWSAWTKQFDAANKPTPSEIGALSVNGGNVAYLEHATYYKINPSGWYGGGAFADQYQNPNAPFLVPYGFATPKDISIYLPIVKGVSHTEYHGYGTSVSFGILRTGKADFGSAIIHIIGDNGAGAIYGFSASGGFNAPGEVYSGGAIFAVGQVSCGGNIVAGQGLYESNGAVRVYSPNNPPPQQNLDPYAKRDSISYVGLAANNSEYPYMRQDTTDAIVYLAARDWVSGYFATSAWTNANFVRDVAMGAEGSFIIMQNGWQRVPAGCAMTGWNAEGQNPGGDTIFYRPIQKYMSNIGWITVGHTA
ncbi:phage tail protein [Enterobacter ludwigii]|uniref:phage tail-collar fiber domain-containing protein n=1 Tax=Enterobacter ludwigii TaxID=299767 RepID=UPI003177C931